MRRALAGAGAMGLGVLAQAALHWGSEAAAIAPVVLAQALIAVVPSAVANPLITLLEHWAMRLLVAACVAAYLLVGLVVGLRPRLGTLALALPWAVGPLGAAFLPATSADVALSLASATLAAALTLTALLAAPTRPDPGRRGVLAGAGALVLLALAGSAGLRALAAAEARIAGAVLALRVTPRPAPPADPAVDPGIVAAARLDPDVTPNDDFYVVDEAIFDPIVDTRRWRLEVAGHVRNALSLTYDELLEMPAVEQYQTLECISNDVGGSLISNAVWVGVPVRALLERAAPLDDSAKVIFASVEGYSSAIPLDIALRPDTLVAYAMNGRALPREHGFPARLLIPGLYGMKNVKWLARIEPTTKDYLGFWERKGWSDEATVFTMSRIDVPQSHEDLRVGVPATIAGVAYAGDRGVSRVEVSVDAGKTWRDAAVGRRFSQATWRRWAIGWTPPAKGFYRLAVRAYDDRGELQDLNQREPLPFGATGVHNYQIEVR